jgi:hypothetical protein
MEIMIICKTHGNMPQVPAGDELHWIPTDTIGNYKLDLGDLYCMGGEGEHDIEVLVLQPSA